MKRFVPAVVPLLAAALAPAPASSAETPSGPLTAAQILDRMDATNNDFADQEMDIRLTIVDVDGSKKSYDLTVMQKGDVKRLVQFTSGELKGMATLVESKNSVYVYLPGFKKVRRVAAHNMNQTIAGSDLTSEDMATTAWGKDWVPSLEKEDETSWWIALAPKPGTSPEYAKVVHRVDKGTFAQRETHYYAKSGEEVKRFMDSDYTDFHGVGRYRHIVVTDPRTGHRTELDLRDFKVNQGLKDELFTVRQLQWGK